MNPIAWAPQPGPQTALIQSTVEDVLFGGSRGGGKTDGLIGDYGKHQHLYEQHARGILFRRTYPELVAVVDRAREVFVPMGARFRQHPPEFKFPNKALLLLRYLDKDTDADGYQGHSYTWAGFDELTQFGDYRTVDKIRATLRSVHGVPTKFRATGNPGGPGHNWVKQRYIDPVPPWTPFTVTETLPDGAVASTVRLFIPSTIDDNKLLTTADPTYWQRVAMAAAGQEWLLKAWRFGIWDIVAGGYFDDLWWPQAHVVEPFEIPVSWRIDRAFDWGSARPFSVGWYAESDGTEAPNGKIYPRGSVFRIAEWYGWNGNPNEGCRMLPRDVGQGIKMLERDWGLAGRVKRGPADAAIFTRDTGKSIADEIAKGGVRFERAENKPGSRRIGWQICRTMLAESRKEYPELPAFYCFSNCRQFIRTVPVLQRARKDPDDVDTDAEDHIADEWRYRLTSRRRAITTVKHRV